MDTESISLIILVGLLVASIALPVAADAIIELSRRFVSKRAHDQAQDEVERAEFAAGGADRAS